MSHIHEKIDFTVTAYIVHENKVLLHMHSKYGIWLGIGGHIELHEDPIEALHREVKEEAGIQIELIGKNPQTFADGSKDLLPPSFMQRHHTSPNHEHVDMLYVARALTTDIQPSPEEAPTEFKWFTTEELDDEEYNILENTKYYSRQALLLAQQNA